MGSYELRKRTPSCEVSIELLQEIEKYIRNIVSEILGESGSDSVDIILEDKYGEEKLDSMMDYPKSKIPSNVHRIILRNEYNPRFRIEVSLSKSIDYSYIQIEVSGESSKERAIGIFNSLYVHLGEQKNLNFLFHGSHNYFMPGLVGVGGGFSASALSGEFIKFSEVIGISLLSIGLIYGLLKIVSPYSVLDTQKNHSVKIATKWVINGLAGVFVFGVIAHYLRGGLIGF